MNDSPTIEIFCWIQQYPQGRVKYFTGCAMSEEGVVLAIEQSATEEGVKEALGAKQGYLKHHDDYSTEYADYLVCWLDYPFGNRKFLSALSLNHVRYARKHILKYTASYYRPIQKVKTLKTK